MDRNKLISSAVNRFGLLDGYAFLRRKLAKSQVIVLMYHRVSPKMDNWSTLILAPKIFELEIEYLIKYYEILPLEILVQYLRQGKSLPKNAAVITLDDGYKDSYLYAYPVLKKYHIPATIFLTTGPISTGELFWWDKVTYVIQNTPLDMLELKELGKYSLQSTEHRAQAASKICCKLKTLSEEKKNCLIGELVREHYVNIPADLGKELILSWKEIREMKDNAITFGAHTVTHPILTKVSLKRAKYEIIQSKRDIEENLGQEATSFCYPNGLFGDFNSEIINIIKGTGFTSAFTAIPGLVTCRANLYELKRAGVDEDFNIFKVMLSGLYPDLRATLSWIRSRS